MAMYRLTFDTDSESSFTIDNVKDESVDDNNNVEVTKCSSSEVTHKDAAVQMDSRLNASDNKEDKAELIKKFLESFRTLSDLAKKVKRIKKDNDTLKAEHRDLNWFMTNLMEGSSVLEPLKNYT